MWPLWAYNELAVPAQTVAPCDLAKAFEFPILHQVPKVGGRWLFTLDSMKLGAPSYETIRDTIDSASYRGAHSDRLSVLE